MTHTPRTYTPSQHSYYAANLPLLAGTEDDAHWTDTVVTQGHADYCASQGHSPITVSGRCARCGDALPITSEYTATAAMPYAPVSAREAVRGADWEMELMPFPIPVPASSNAVAGVIAEWIDDASGLYAVKAGAYYRPYVAEDAPYARTPNPARTLDYDAPVGYSHAARIVAGL